MHDDPSCDVLFVRLLLIVDASSASRTHMTSVWSKHGLIAPAADAS